MVCKVLKEPRYRMPWQENKSAEGDAETAHERGWRDEHKFTFELQELHFIVMIILL